jgi:hypothetical protein
MRGNVSIVRLRVRETFRSLRLLSVRVVEDIEGKKKPPTVVSWWLLGLM